MVLQELRERILELEKMQARLLACLEDVGRAREEAKAQLAQLSREDLRLRPLAAVAGPPAGFKHTHLSVEHVRDAVVELKHFTIGELAAQLGCSHARARKEVQRVTHIVKPAGQLGRQQLWAYVPPEGPGEAFEAQQRLRVVETGELPLPAPADGAQEVKQSIVSMISTKEIKQVVREAIADGWRLVHRGGKHHLALVKGDRTVTISSTPKNAGDAARAIRRQLAS